MRPCLQCWRNDAVHWWQMNLLRTEGYLPFRYRSQSAVRLFARMTPSKTWFTALRQALGEKTEASFSFRRHSDLFVLYRDRPEVFTNHHADESYQAALRRKETLSDNVSVHYGAEGYHDSIVSNNLGNHSRSRGAGYASLDVRALKRFSFSIGAREEIYRSFSGQFSPSVSGGVWLSQRFKLRGSVSRAFPRMMFCLPSRRCRLTSPVSNFSFRW